MGSEKIRFGLVTRVLVFAVLLSGTLLLAVFTRWIITPALSAVITLFCAVEIVRYAERSERNFHSFLHAIRYKDYTYLQNMGRKRPHAQYRALFEEVMDEFRKLKAERESHYESMQLILEQLEAGVICFERQTGKILFINPAALEMVGKPHLTHFYKLEELRPELFSRLADLQPGRSSVLSCVIREKATTLTGHAKDFRMMKRDMRLIILQNIKNELDSQEILSWQKLISVLTHEIMNSVTPVISLADFAADGLSEENIERIKTSAVTAEELEELRLSMTIIRNRSQNLVRFVQNYRNLTRIPHPEKKPTDLQMLCRHIAELFRLQLRQENISLGLMLTDEPCIIMADSGLIEQVLINLIKNAAEAVRMQEERAVIIRLYRRDQQPVLEVEDNGPGISPGHLEQIFVPFFTTKAQGSGVGLSLSKQIMRLHGGNIYVKTTEGRGTVFTLEFS